MTVKLSELRVSSSFETAGYKAGMDQKVAADRTGAASSAQLGIVVTDTSQKLSGAARSAESLSRSYIAGYAQAAKFEGAIHALGRSVETGAVPIGRVGPILDGIYAKFGRTADASAVAGRSYVGLAMEMERLAVAGTIGTASASRLGGTLQASGHQAALSSSAMMNLSMQMNDVITMAALGADPFRILATQMGQVYQVLAIGEGGVRGSLGYLAATLSGFATPGRIAAVAIAGVGAAAALAANSIANASREIDLSLTGIGGAAGITAEDVNRISAAAADAGITTVGSAREMTLAFAATGRISAEVAENLVSAGRGIAKIYGEDVSQAAARLARAFSDPGKGVDELNQRLGAFDDVTSQNIKSLAAQNNILDAQRLLLAGILQSTVTATNATSDLERAWNDVTTTASKYWDAAGRNTRLFFGGGSAQERYIKLQEELGRLIEANDNAWTDFQRKLNQPAIDNKLGEIAKVQQELDDQSREAYERSVNRDAVDAGNFARGLVPGFSSRRTLEDQASKARSYTSDPHLSGHVDADLMDRAARSAELMVANYKSALDIAKEEHGFTLETIVARTTAQRADIAYRQTLAKSSREGDLDAEARAEMKRAEVVAQAAQVARQANEQRLFASDQSIETARTELSLVGASADVRQRELSLIQARQQLENEALRTEGDRNAYDKQHLDDLEQRIRLQQELNRQIAEEQLKRDLNFELQQLGRSPIEQTVYSRLNSAGMLTDGKIQSAQAEMNANQIRFTESVRLSQEVTREFAGNFVSDIKNGTSGVEALGNAFDRLADRLISMALDSSINQLFSSLTGTSSLGAPGMGGAFTNLFGGGSAAAGGIGDWSTIVSVMHNGGLVGANDSQTRRVPMSTFANARRYHSGGVIGTDEVPAILQRGEIVLPKGQAAARGGDSIVVNMPLTINAPGADAAGLVAVKAEVQKLRQEVPVLATNAFRKARDRKQV